MSAGLPKHKSLAQVIEMGKCFTWRSLSWKTQCERLLKAISKVISIMWICWKWKKMKDANVWILWSSILYTPGHFTLNLMSHPGVHGPVALLNLETNFFSYAVVCSAHGFLKKYVGYYSTENITDADFIPRPLSLFRHVTLIKAHVYWRGLLNLL